MASPEILAAHSSDQLRRWHTDLLSHIPSDPSFAVAVGAVLRSIIGNELTHPDRLARDKEVAEAAIASERAGAREEARDNPDALAQAREQAAGHGPLLSAGPDIRAE